MDSKYLLAEVQACCSSLGYLDNGVYHKGEDHLNAIKVSQMTREPDGRHDKFRA